MLECLSADIIRSEKWAVFQSPASENIWLNTEAIYLSFETFITE